MKFYPDKEDYLIADWFKSFIYDAFNYFNGKVNVINSHVNLVFYDSYTYDGIMGTTDFPSRLIINPVNILLYVYQLLDDDVKIIDDKSTRFTKEFEDLYKSSLVNIIVHELFHLDQIINHYALSPIDSTNAYKINSYNVKVEEDVYAMTALYMRSNSEIIKNRFGIDNLNCILINGVFTSTKVPHYNRLKPYDYYIQLFQEIGNKDIFFNINTLTTVLYEDPNIRFTTDEYDIWIKSCGNFILESIPFVSQAVNDIIGNQYIYKIFIYKYSGLNSTSIRLIIENKTFTPGKFILEKE